MRHLRSLVWTSFAVALLVTAGCGSSGSTSAATTLSPVSAVSPAGTTSHLLAPAAVDALLKAPPSGLIVVDVRTPAEFATGHLAAAVDLDLQGASFATAVAALDPKVPYLVYCHSGNRSAQAVTYLAAHGFTTLYELQGGITAWQAAGLPVVTS